MTHPALTQPPANPFSGHNRNGLTRSLWLSDALPQVHVYPQIPAFGEVPNGAGVCAPHPFITRLINRIGGCQ